MRPMVRFFLGALILGVLISETASLNVPLGSYGGMRRATSMNLRGGGVAEVLHACNNCGKFFAPASLASSTLPTECRDCLLHLRGGVAAERPYDCYTCGQFFAPESLSTHNCVPRHCACNPCGKFDVISPSAQAHMDGKYSGTSAFRGKAVEPCDQEAVSEVRAACGPELLVLPADADERAYTIFLGRFHCIPWPWHLTV